MTPKSPIFRRLYACIQWLAFVADGTWYRPAWMMDAELTNAFIGWHAHLRKRPWIVYMHLMQVHYPYGDTRGQHLMPNEDLNTAPPDLDPGMDPKTMASYIEAYDADIPYTDGCIGRIIDDLQRRGDLNRTVIVITADHGEEFGEHGAMGHGKSFHREVTHVPLLIFVPYLKGSRWITTPAHQIDLLPTLLALAGLPADSHLSGQNLGKLIMCRRRNFPPEIF